MKWLFFLLLIGNVGFYAWDVSDLGNVEEVRRPVYAPPASQKILTLNEAPIVFATPEALPAEDFEAQLRAVVEKEERRILSQKNTPLANDSVKESEPSVCAVLEVEKEQEAARLMVLMQEQGWRFKETQELIDRLKYWLYIPAPESRNESLAIVQALKIKGVDSFIINRGEMKNRISLGLYSSSETASVEQQRIQALSGYQIDIFEHTRKVTVTRLELIEKHTINEWQSFIGRDEITKMMIKIEKNDC